MSNGARNLTDACLGKSSSRMHNSWLSTYIFHLGQLYMVLYIIPTKFIPRCEIFKVLEAKTVKMSLRPCIFQCCVKHKIRQTKAILKSWYINPLQSLISKDVLQTCGKPVISFKISLKMDEVWSFNKAIWCKVIYYPIRSLDTKRGVVLLFHLAATQMC